MIIFNSNHGCRPSSVDPAYRQASVGQTMNLYNAHTIRKGKALHPRDYLTHQVMQARLFMDKHYAGKLHIVDLAGKAFLSNFHFIRLFKAYFGYTPYQYLTGVRIKNAKRLLATHATISDICFEVGFENVSYFTGLFKKMTGTTPSAFRKSRP